MSKLTLVQKSPDFWISTKQSRRLLTPLRRQQKMALNWWCSVRHLYQATQRVDLAIKAREWLGYIRNFTTRLLNNAVVMESDDLTPMYARGGKKT